MTIGKRTLLKIVLPLLIVGIGVGVAYLIYAFRPRVERREVTVLPPLVRVLEVETRDVPLNVFSQGTVEPRIESGLVAQVPGRVDRVSPHFADGGFFKRGAELVLIDQRDYRLAVSGAEALVAQARVRLELEQAEANVARQEWEDLGEGEPTTLTLREPQLAEAKAALQSAEAVLERARLDLERTEIRAPYDGRIRVKMVDIGQYVTPGSQLATIYSTDHAEIRLPVRKGDLAFLDIDLGSSGEKNPGPPVLLRGELAGRSETWSGHIVRTDSSFDPKTRMLDLFARVDDPFRLQRGAGGSPLPIGMFVEAEIGGYVAQDAVVLPRAALREKNRVLVVDDDDRLRYRDVELVRIVRDEAVVNGGLSVGERVCISPLEAVVDGMKVRTILEGDGRPDVLEVGETS